MRIQSVSNVAPSLDPSPELRRVARSLQAVFIGEILKAMRATVPNGGPLAGPAGESFQVLFDQHLAEQISSTMDSDLVLAIERNLARHVQSTMPSSTER